VNACVNAWLLIFVCGVRAKATAPSFVVLFCVQAWSHGVATVCRARDTVYTQGVNVYKV
jgi:hypothetical protein